MKDHCKRWLLAALAGLAWPMVAHAQPALSLDQVVAKVQANYDSAKTYSAAFRQEITSPSFGRTLSEGKGEISFKKPGKMVWKYDQPEPHVYYLDGNTLYDYYPAQKQAVKMGLDQALAQNTPKSFLFGMGKLQAEFEISFHAGRPSEPDGSVKLDLVPRAEAARAALGALVFTVDPKEFLVREVEMTDALGNLNHLWFEKIKLNPTLDARQLRWGPPPDVKVLTVEEPPAAPVEKP